MIETVVNQGLGLAALIVLIYVLVERIRVMNWRSHPWPVVMLHVLVALMCGSVAYAGLYDQSIADAIGYADDIRALGTAAEVAACALWMWSSRRAFRAGQEGHRRRRTSDYMPLLDDSDMRRVSGGSK